MRLTINQSGSCKADLRQICEADWEKIRTCAGRGFFFPSKVRSTESSRIHQGGFRASVAKATSQIQETVSLVLLCCASHDPRQIGKTNLSKIEQLGCIDADMDATRSRSKDDFSISKQQLQYKE